MSVFDSIRAQLVPIHREGYPFIGAFALLSIVLFLLWSPLGWLGTLATLWCAYFFRDPPRVTPLGDGLVVAPADGHVSQVTSAVPPVELALGPAALARVSIFMSVFDCHVNRSPIGGRVERIVYKAGKFLNADLDKASEDNERNCLVVASPGGRIGMIRFGSRVDVYLPPGVRPLVSEGQMAIAGETVIADLAAREAGR